MEVDRSAASEVLVGETVPVRATVVLGPISPENVTVQAYYGATVNQEIVNPATVEPEPAREDGEDHFARGERHLRLPRQYPRGGERLVRPERARDSDPPEPHPGA